MVGNIAYLFALWVLTVITTKMAGYDNAGIFTLAMSIGNVFYQLEVYGMQTFQVSDVSGEFRINQYIYARYATVAVSAAGCLLYCLLGGYTVEKGVSIMSFLLLKSCEALSLTYFAELQKIGRLDVLAKSMLAKSGLMIVIFTLVLRVTKRLSLALLSIGLLAAVITFAYDRTRCHALVSIPREKFTFQDIKGPLRRCFPLMVSCIIPVIVTALPRIQLERYNGEELLGYYGNVSAPTVLITAVVPMVMYPVLTWYGELVQAKKWGSLTKGFAASASAFVALSLLACAAIYLVGDFVMALVFSKEIVPYVHYMYPLVGVMALDACNACANNVLIALRRERLVMTFSVVALVIACVCCIPFVKRYAIMGAIAVLGVAYIVQMTALFICVIIVLHRKKRETQA